MKPSLEVKSLFSKNMKRSDIISALVIGEIVAVFLIFVLKNLGYFFNSLWLSLVVLPILALLALYITYLLGRKFPAIFQFGKFASVGLANFGVDLGILNILMLISGTAGGVAYSFFKGISFIVATIHSYFWNKFWTFRKTETKEMGKESLQFFVVSLIGLVINVGVASLVVNLIGVQWGLSAAIWGSLGAVAGSISGLAWNFLGYKFIVFKK